MPLQEYDILSGQNFSFTGTHPEKFHKIGVLKTSQKSQKNTIPGISFLKMLQDENPVKIFSYECG